MEWIRLPRRVLKAAGGSVVRLDGSRLLYGKTVQEEDSAFANRISSPGRTCRLHWRFSRAAVRPRSYGRFAQKWPEARRVNTFECDRLGSQERFALHAKGMSHVWIAGLIDYTQQGGYELARTLTPHNGCACSSRAGCLRYMAGSRGASSWSPAGSP